MSLLDGIRAKHRRLARIIEFSRGGLTLSDRLKMSVLGYARGHDFSGRDFVSRIGRAIFPEITLQPCLLRGLGILINPADISHLVVTEEVLLERIYDLGALPFKPDIVLDCGAHIGLFTLLAAANFPDAEFIAFEPDPHNAEWLRKQVAGNAFSVDVVEAAVSVEDGSALFTAGLGCSSALAEILPSGGEQITVATVNLPRIVERMQSKKLLLKLDIEGAEQALVPSLMPVLPEECAIFIESHDFENGWMKLSNWFEEAGFETAVTRRRGKYVDGFACRSASNR